MLKTLTNRKGHGGLIAVIIIIIALVFLGWLVNINQRECNRDKDCARDSYCGSDFSCHQYPTVQRTIVEYNLFWPAVIVAIGIIAAAWIFKRESITIREEPKIVEEHVYVEKKPEEVEEITEPYYKSGNGYYKNNGNVKVP